jgi:aryl-alcohol dehydrogenase-like predicted oxidoreductase
VSCADTTAICIRIFQDEFFDKALRIADNARRFDAHQNGSLAQLVEQWTLNPLVESSSLSRPTISA